MTEISNEKKEEINSKINNGLIIKREEVGGKVRYSYTLYLDCNPTNSDSLKAVEYAKEQLENIIIGKKVEDKVNALKAIEAEQ